MPSFWDRINPVGSKSFTMPIANKSFRKGALDFLTGTPEEREQVSNLTPEQLEIQGQLEGASKQRGAGGAFGTSADYYRDLMSNDSADYNAFAAPELRNFRENIIPDISEQFAGMGSGALSSSGFRNAAVGAGTDLSERLGAIRARLRESGAQGLMNIGQQSLMPHTQWQTTQPGSSGFLGQIAPAAGAAAGAYFGGPGVQAGSALGNAFSNSMSGMNQRTSPYGNQNIGNQSNNSFSSLPSFNPRAR